LSEGQQAAEGRLEEDLGGFSLLASVRGWSLLEKGQRSKGRGSIPSSLLLHKKEFAIHSAVS
jgi:hypothetical protein